LTHPHKVFALRPASTDRAAITAALELSSEDNFRLNVLLANRPKAIRIDESKLVVYGLSDKGEAKVVLNPSGRPEQ
jgi:hypothetical protein